MARNITPSATNMPTGVSNAKAANCGTKNVPIMAKNSKMKVVLDEGILILLCVREFNMVCMLAHYWLPFSQQYTLLVTQPY